jgi:hypothetical protein
MKLKIKKRVLESLLTEKDNRRILIDKEGVSEEIANWAHNLSDKLSIWIVKSLKDKYARYTANLPQKPSLDDYYMSLDSDYRDIIGLTKKQNKPNFNLKELSFDEALSYVPRYEYIESWLNDPAVTFVNLATISWDEAETMARDWHNSLTVGGEIEGLDDGSELIHKFADGYYWSLSKVQTCTKSAKSMGHCGTAAREGMWLLHLRKNNKEAVTIDWHPTEKYSIQIKGKQNNKPHPKYFPYITWLIRDWGNIEQLRTDKGHRPETNFHLGDLDPDVAAEIYGANPNIMNVQTMLEKTPNNHKAKLIANLFKYDSFVDKLIPYGFANFFELVDNKNMVIGALLNNPTFLEKMNKYRGLLTYTIEQMVNGTNAKDKLIEALLKREGLIEMLDEEGIQFLINSHSNPDMVEEIILDAEMSDEDLYESVKFKKRIITELRRKFIR